MARPAAAHARQPKKAEEPLTGRARVPARRDGVPEAKGVFSPLIREGSGLRERRIARTRSLPTLGPAAAGTRLNSCQRFAPSAVSSKRQTPNAKRRTFIYVILLFALLF
jgi:hypothetical protein